MTRFATALAVATALTVATLGCSGSTPVPRSLQVVDAWARPPTPGARTAAVYLTLRVPRAEALVGARVPRRVAAEVSIHESSAAADRASDGNGAGHDMASMRALDRLELAPGTVRFEPGGLHLMVERLRRRGELPNPFRLTLRFRDHAPLRVTVAVRDAAPG